MTHLPHLKAVISTNDLSYDRMPNDILCFQGVKTNFFDILQDLARLPQTRLVGIR